MDNKNIAGVVRDIIEALTPLFRAVWVVTVLIGLVMAVLAFLLKRNPARKKSPWIVGGLGAVMVVSAGTQLIFSLFH